MIGVNAMADKLTYAELLSLFNRPAYQAAHIAHADAEEYLAVVFYITQRNVQHG